MKHYVPIFLALVALVALPVSADHDDSATRPHDNDLREKREALVEERKEAHEQFRGEREDRRETIKDRMEERRAAFAETRERWKAAVEDHVKERVLNRATVAARILDGMIDRLEKLAARIEARIEVLKEDGRDTDDAEAALARANTQIEEASDAAEKLKEMVREALASETPREALKDVKPYAATVKAEVREAHEALRAAVKALPNAE